MSTPPRVPLPMSYPAFLDSADPAIYALRTTAPGPTGKLPLTAQLLRGATSGHVFGMTQNAGMGWDPRKLLGKEFLILSTQGGIRAPDGTPVALGYHTGHWEIGLLVQAAAEEFRRLQSIPFVGFCSDPCDGRTQGTTGMFDSLPYRNDAAMVFRRLIRSLPVRAGVLGIATCDKGLPAMMMALHIWSMSHGVASLFVGRSDTMRRKLPMPAEDLLEAGLLIYLQSLGLAKGDRVAERVADTSTPNLAGRGRLVAITLFATARALNGLVFSSISAHAVPLFQGLGFRGDEAVFMAALIGPSQVASRLGEIMMGRRLTPMQLGLIAFGLLPVAVGIFALMGFSWPAAIVFAVLYGASNGLVTIAKGAVTNMITGVKSFTGS